MTGVLILAQLKLGEKGLLVVVDVEVVAAVVVGVEVVILAVVVVNGLVMGDQLSDEGPPNVDDWIGRITDRSDDDI